MNTEKAIKLLREMQEAWKLQITGDAYDALEMAITALENNSTQQLNNSINNSNNSINNSNNAIGFTACRVPEDDYISRQAAIRIASGFCHPANVAKELAKLPSVQPEIKPIEYRDCANAMLRMWMDNVVTDGEYNRIMDKLNAHWRVENG